MRIGIAVFRGLVAPRLDFSEQLLIYEIEDNNIILKSTVNLVLNNYFEILTLLKSEGINYVICGGGPRGFLRNLYFNGIEILNGGFLSPDKAIELFLKNQLSPLSSDWGGGRSWGGRKRFRRGFGGKGRKK